MYNFLNIFTIRTFIPIVWTSSSSWITGIWIFPLRTLNPQFVAVKFIAVQFFNKLIGDILIFDISETKSPTSLGISIEDSFKFDSISNGC